METQALQPPTAEDVIQAWSSQNAGVPRRQMEFSVRFQVQATDYGHIAWVLHPFAYC